MRRIVAAAASALLRSPAARFSRHDAAELEFKYHFSASMRIRDDQALRGSGSVEIGIIDLKPYRESSGNVANTDLDLVSPERSVFRRLL